MKVRKAVITAAGPNQRTLPLQTLTDRDGEEKTILRLLLDEVFSTDVEQACVVIAPGDQLAYRQAAGDLAARVEFIDQTEPRGYGHAVFCARPFAGEGPFLHLVGDHVYVDRDGTSCARRLTKLAEQEECAVSSVQPTRESQIGHFGTIGGQQIAGSKGLYRIEKVTEKPTPTEAEQHLVVAGLRAGHYLCFFGMHVFTPVVMEMLANEVHEASRNVSLSCVLNQLAKQEQYLAFEESARRYDLGDRYGLLTAQLALALGGVDREEVLGRLVELLALRAQDQASNQTN
jgi:UTP--glucose-1-phosphate uridylyltransferase